MLVERASQLASLGDLLGEALDGHGRLVFLGGEAGVGKTALAAALAGTVPGSATVRRGFCDSITTAEPLGPILDALPEITAAAGPESGVTRLRLFRQAREALAGSPAVLLLLEDVHWADEATLDFLRFAGRRLAGQRLMIVATFRSEEAGAEHPLTLMMGDLAGLPGVLRMYLPALSLAGVRELVAAAGSALNADDVHARTAGNPFYVTEVLAAGSEHVPATIRDAVLARLARLSPAARQVAGAVSVLGRRAEPALLAAVSGQPGEAVEECLARGMLVTVDGGVGFRHDLARLAVERSLAGARRSELHRRALAQLTASASADHRLITRLAAATGSR